MWHTAQMTRHVLSATALSWDMFFRTHPKREKNQTPECAGECSACLSQVCFQNRNIESKNIKDTQTSLCDCNLIRPRRWGKKWGHVRTYIHTSQPDMFSSSHRGMWETSWDMFVGLGVGGRNPTATTDEHVHVSTPTQLRYSRFRIRTSQLLTLTLTQTKYGTIISHDNGHYTGSQFPF